MKPTLLVFAKAPRLGSGKTRLAAAIGRAGALRINRWLQSRTMSAIRDPRWRAVLCVSPDRGTSLLWPPCAPRRPQGPGDLGARLARAFAGTRGPCAVIGADIPDISKAAIAEGFAGLRRARFVIGPAEDGGFWFFAARKPSLAAPAFARVRWSTAHAAADLRDALPGGPRAEVRRLCDIDTWDDWRSWRASRRRGTL